jgi:SPP1 family predicted phage head-tail adaptor
MVRADVIGLVTEVNSAHGVHETITESVREVLAEIRSVSRSEYYNALNAGVQPELVFKLALDADYQDEHFLRYGGKKYRIVRTYLTNDGGIEITAERSDENGTDEIPDDPDAGDADGND